MIEEGGERIEEDNRKLRWIVAYNNRRMGVREDVEKEGAKVKRRNDSMTSQVEDEDAEMGEGLVREEKILTYNRDTYPREVFQALEELRDCSLLTDLTLCTENGPSINAHSPVLAAVSSLIYQKLQERDGERERRRESEGDDTHSQKEMSIGLGPEVGCVGLAGVLEFAYTGAIGALSRDTLAQIQAAALTLGVTRVLDLCSEEEERMKNGRGGKTVRKISVAEQMKVSLQAIRQLWTERVGCDVELEADGTSFHGG